MEFHNFINFSSQLIRLFIAYTTLNCLWWCTYADQYAYSSCNVAVLIQSVAQYYRLFSFTCRNGYKQHSSRASHSGQWWRRWYPFTNEHNGYVWHALLVILQLSLFLFVVLYACMYLLAGVETSKHARSARSTTNQPQPTSTSLEGDTDGELSGEPTCDSFSYFGYTLCHGIKTFWPQDSSKLTKTFAVETSYTHWNCCYV